jgi:hypothetical protein
VQVVLISIAIALLALYKIDRAAHQHNLMKLAEAVAAEAQAASVADSPRLG